MKTNCGIFLDRDGTLIVDREYLRDRSAVELIAGTADAIGILRELGCHLFLFSNQSGVARGLLTPADVDLCNEEMLDQIGLGQIFDGVCIAMEGPDDILTYRKPSPRFINEMVEKHVLNREFCHMVGDRSSDLLAAINGGIKAAFVRTGKLRSDTVEDLIRRGLSLEFENLLEFARHLQKSFS
ncbi:MAG: HAD-IIIA family hydrolase [Puniceicoccales bacterium]|jgi:D-glycero-D-manno-heptose 1,7-bisphosphate phosphatase|nr:HAD-IIIA family hydrolase [Puniceicoccales bacterium]